MPEVHSWAAASLVLKWKGNISTYSSILLSPSSSSWRPSSSGYLLLPSSLNLRLHLHFYPCDVESASSTKTHLLRTSQGCPQLSWPDLRILEEISTNLVRIRHPGRAEGYSTRPNLNLHRALRNMKLSNVLGLAALLIHSSVAPPVGASQFSSRSTTPKSNSLQIHLWSAIYPSRSKRRIYLLMPLLNYGMKLYGKGTNRVGG